VHWAFLVLSSGVLSKVIFGIMTRSVAEAPIEFSWFS